MDRPSGPGSGSATSICLDRILASYLTGRSTGTLSMERKGLESKGVGPSAPNSIHDTHEMSRVGAAHNLRTTYERHQ